MLDPIELSGIDNSFLQFIISACNISWPYMVVARVSSGSLPFQLKELNGMLSKV
jgi:hypothetical protein